jgi:hypothetical protein
MDIPQELLESMEGGLVTVNVAQDVICPHAFQVFVDHDKKIRGYQKIDFVVELNKRVQVSVHNAFDGLKTTQITAQNIMHIASTDIFLLITKSLLLGIPITIISKNASFNEGLVAFFEEALPDIRAATFVDKYDYEAGCKWEDGLVVDINYKMVSQNPSNNPFLMGEELANSLWNAPDAPAQKILFNNFINHVKEDYELFKKVISRLDHVMKIKELYKIMEMNHIVLDYLFLHTPFKKERTRFLYDMLLRHNPLLAKKIDASDR